MLKEYLLFWKWLVVHGCLAQLEQPFLFHDQEKHESKTLYRPSIGVQAYDRDWPSPPPCSPPCPRTSAACTFKLIADILVNKVLHLSAGTLLASAMFPSICRQRACASRNSRAQRAVALEPRIALGSRIRWTT